MLSTAAAVANIAAILNLNAMMHFDENCESATSWIYAINLNAQPSPRDKQNIAHSFRSKQLRTSPDS